MKVHPLILMFLALLLSANLSAQMLHVILMADTEHANPKFAESCLSDYENMRKKTIAMAQGVNYERKEYPIIGAKFTPEKAESIVAAIKPAPEDVIFFYYTGVAFCNIDLSENIRNKNRVFRMGPEGEDELSTISLYETLIAKNARLNILMADACGLVVKTKAHKGNNSGGSEGVYASLLSACGTLRVFSSQCTEYSYCDDKGGLFTNAFLATIDRFIDEGKKDLTWKELLKETAQLTERVAKKIFRYQHSVFFFEEGWEDECLKP